MDRQIVYPGAIPLETDLLNTNKNAMIGMSKLAAAILGASTFLNGLACTPTGPASLQVYVAAGEIYSLQNIDGTAYSSIAADTTHAILKQGISLDQLTLSCPAPVTAGQSINYLIQATYQDTDASAVVLPYYNSSNPSQAYAGPANSGTAQNTVRKGVCAVSAKAGVAATTGTQTTPAPDAGYIGAFVVTVAYGQTQITAPNISTYAGAPLIPAGGLIVGGLQQNACISCVAGGTADAITGSFFPGITALPASGAGLLTLYVRPTAANATTTPTFTPNSGTITAKQIVKGAGSALVAGDIAGAGHWIELQYDPPLDKWVLLNPATGVSGVTAGQLQAQTYTAFTTGGATGTFTLTPSPAVGAYAANQRFRAKFHAVGNGSDTINVSGLGAKNIKQYDGTGTKVAPIIVANQLADIEYDGTDFVILDPLPSTTAQASTTEISNESAVQKYISPDRLSSSKRVAKAWVNFDGTLTGTITPRANLNVGSVTKGATGNFTLNYTSALADANYAITITGQSTSLGLQGVSLFMSGTYTTTATQVWTGNAANGSASDAKILNALVMGN